MKHIAKSATGLLFAALLAPFSALAADLYVISHPSLDIASTDVRDVYLGEKQFSGQVRLHPMDNGSAQEPFLAKVMQMSPTAYATAWTKKAFRQGLSQPASVSSDAEVLQFVRGQEGAIGYVRSVPPAGVKVLQKLAY